MANNYQKGRRIEYIAKKTLESYGFTVIRSAGSHGAVDLVAWNSVTFLFVQLKKFGVDSPEDYKKLAAFNRPRNSEVELWEYNRGDWVCHYLKNGKWLTREGLGF